MSEASQLHSTVYNLISKMHDPRVTNKNVIEWGAPIPAFGCPQEATIATLGLNPSNKEFVDNSGKELVGAKRRFHTLSSLNLKSWSEAEDPHINLIIETCREYFARNPYDTWFKKLDFIISGTNSSFYPHLFSHACHLDLVPLATRCKWGELTNEQKLTLLDLTGEALGLILKNSNITHIVLNGQSVIEGLEYLSGTKFTRRKVPAWELKRKSGSNVSGFSCKGYISKIHDIDLNREVIVLGYNHNIQSSFGVTNSVTTSIRNWISRNIEAEIK